MTEATDIAAKAIANFARHDVIPHARMMMERHKRGAVEKEDVEQALDSAFSVIDKLVESLPNERPF